MKKKTNWATTDKRFVAFLDILGFKDLVMRNKHNDIYNKLADLSKAKELLEEIVEDPDFIHEIGNAEIYSVSFSDSIAIFSKNDDIENFNFFLVAVRYFFAKTIESGTTIKGALALGDISINKSKQIYFGQAIIDAYLIEENVNYLGITAHCSIDNYIEKNKDSLDMDFINNILFECNTPFKFGNIVHRNINWFQKLRVYENANSDDEKVKSIENTINSFKTSISGSPRRYLDNTLKILQQID